MILIMSAEAISVHVDNNMKPEDHDALKAILAERLTVVMEKDYGYYGDTDVIASVRLDGVEIHRESTYVTSPPSYYSSCSCGV